MEPSLAKQVRKCSKPAAPSHGGERDDDDEEARARAFSSSSCSSAPSPSDHRAECLEFQGRTGGFLLDRCYCGAGRFEARGDGGGVGVGWRRRRGGRSGKSEQADAGKPARGGPIPWLSFLLLLVTGGGIVVYYDKEKKRHIEELKNKTSSMKQGQSGGTATIGGPFTLLNHDGKPVTEKDFLGKWTLLYFVFTHCPDICPDEFQKMAAAIGKIKERAKLEIVPVLITADPDRHC